MCVSGEANFAAIFITSIKVIPRQKDSPVCVPHLLGMLVLHRANEGLVFNGWNQGAAIGGLEVLEHPKRDATYGPG
jgi:hypothetical protein